MGGQLTHRIPPFIVRSSDSSPITIMISPELLYQKQISHLPINPTAIHKNHMWSLAEVTSQVQVQASHQWVGKSSPEPIDFPDEKRFSGVNSPNETNPLTGQWMLTPKNITISWVKCPNQTHPGPGGPPHCCGLQRGPTRRRRDPTPPPSPCAPRAEPVRPTGRAQPK